MKPLFYVLLLVCSVLYGGATKVCVDCCHKAQKMPAKKACVVLVKEKTEEAIRIPSILI